MAATATGGYSRRSGNAPVLRSASPAPRFHLPAASSSSSSAFASSTSGFASRSSTFFSRSASPTRVNLYSHAQTRAAPSVRFSLDRPTSPNRSISAVNPSQNHVVKKQVTSTTKRTCMCSPTTHPGSFRCSLHKSIGSSSGHGSYSSNSNHNRLNARRSAMTNSLVRIGGVEGDLVKRALAALIRPSSHQQRRRGAFQPRPSRLSQMSKAEDVLTG